MTAAIGPEPPRCLEHVKHGKGCPNCRRRAAWYFRYRAEEIAAGRWQFGRKTKDPGQKVSRCPDHPRRFQKGCKPCRVWAAWYNLHRKTLIAAGRWDPPVPAGQVAPHLSYLRDGGMSDAQIAERAGVSANLARDARLGRIRQVTAVTAEALLGVRLPPVHQRKGFIDTTRTRRQLQALTCANWPQRVVADRLGRRETTVKAWGSDTATMRPADAATIDAFFTANVRTPGPGAGRYAVAKARRLGYLPWYAWRDDEIGDPTVDPCQKVPTVAVRRRLRACAAMGWSPADIAARFDALDVQLLEQLMRNRPTVSRVPRWVHNAVEYFTDLYADKTGTSDGLAVEAREEGWATPLAWYGRDLEDPAARPLIRHDRNEPVPEFGSGITLAIGGYVGRSDLTDVETVVVVEHFRRVGRSDLEITQALRWPGKDPVEALKRFMAPSRRPVLPAELVAA